MRLAGGPARSGDMVVAGAAVSVLIGWAVGASHGLLAAMVLVMACAFAVGICEWRRAVYGLLAYLPFSGVPILASYPRTTIAVLLKDFLFVLPAYLGFAVWAVANRQRILFNRALAVLLGLLSALVLAQALNPSLPSRLVGLVGAKVWLFYLPLWVLGYHLVRKRRDLDRLLAVMSIAAVVPVLLGLTEAVLIYSGHPAQVYRWYGVAASAATQDFAELAFEGGGALRRVPSTFSFVSQYYAFVMAMLAVTYAWWKGVLAGTRWSVAGAGLWALVLLAGLASGARGALLSIPLVVVLLLVLERRGGRLPFGRLATLVLVLVTTIALVGLDPRRLSTGLARLGLGNFHDVFLKGFREALRLTVGGLGTGIDTNAGRYVAAGSGRLNAVQGVWYESWFVKAVLELGVAGLLLVTLIVGTLALGTLRERRLVTDHRLRAIWASLAVVLLWNIVYSLKGQYIDMDPTNVYFWLFAGVLARVPALARQAPVEREEASGARS